MVCAITFLVSVAVELNHHISPATNELRFGDWPSITYGFFLCVCESVVALILILAYEIFLKKK